MEENQAQPAAESAKPEEIKSAKQLEVPQALLDETSGRYPIELISEQTLEDATIEECENLLTVMRGMNQALIRKADLIHMVMEAKGRKEIQDKKIAGASEADIAEMEAAIARRKAKPPTQNLVGSHITSDNVVNPGQ